MSVIAQTNRCILFEAFNEESEDLLTLLGDGSTLYSLNDDKVKEINEHLLVRNFEDFITKFKPCIYAYFDAANQEMIYTVSKPNLPDALVYKTVLDQNHNLIQLFLRMFDAKKENDARKQLFNFEHFLQFLSPEHKIEEFRNIREKLVKAFKKYVSVPEDQEEKQKKYYSKAEKVLEEMDTDLYDLMSLIPIALEDMKQKLMPEDETVIRWDPINDGVSKMKEKDLHIVNLPVQGRIQADDIKDKKMNQLKDMIINHYRSETKTENTYIEHLLLRAYGIEPIHEAGEQREQLVEQYNQYLSFYKEAMERFLEVVKPLLQKILGVKVFFDQYQVKEPRMGMELLITNVKNEKWMQPDYAKRFTSYLNTVNLKTDFTNTIWMAVIPTVTFPPEKLKKLRRERFKGNQRRYIERTNSIEQASAIMALTAQYGILTFFSYECDETTTFAYTSAMGIDHFIDGCKPFIGKTYSEYAVPCIPNFTIIPKERSYLLVGTKLKISGRNEAVQSEEKEDILKIWMGGVHVEAAYVASGLTAAYQCPAFLKERYGAGADDDLPGVRYHLEEDDHRYMTTTAMAKEITGYEDWVNQNIEEKSFGFIFSPETKYHKNKRINHVTVSKTRNLYKVDGTFEPIYKVLTEKYIERVFRYDTFDYKKAEIVRFFQNHPNNRRNVWQAARKKVNAILHEEDSLDYELDEMHDVCVLEMMFGDQPSSIHIDLAPHKSEQEGED